MRGLVVAAVVALSGAAMACASSQIDPPPVWGLDASTPESGSAQGQGEASTPDEGGSAETGAAPGPDDAGGDDAGGGGADASGAVEAGSRDAGMDAVADASPALPGSCDPARWVVSASASASNNPPAFAVDGFLPTRWSSGAGQAVGQYFQVDFGGSVVVDQIVLDDSFSTNEHTDYPRGLDVLGSSDGSNFPTTLGSASFAIDPGGIVTVSIGPSTIRALRLQLTTGVPASWWSIHELRLGCRALETDGGRTDSGAEGGPDGGSSDGGGTSSCAAPDAGWTPNSGISTTSWTGSASSTGPNDTVQGAFDQSPTTRWSSGQAQVGGEWFKVDLGQMTSISRVSLYLLSGDVTDSPSAYALQLSSDDQSYATVASGLGAPNTNVCLSHQSARYVKVTQTGTGDPSWWSIYEISVFP